MSCAPLRIGLIVPSSNTVMEPDFHRHFKQEAVVSTTRIFLEQVTRDAELHMLEEELPRAVRLIKTTAPDTVVFGCTSAGALGGLAHDEGIRQTIEKATGVQTVTVLQAVLTQLRTIRPQKIAVFTPYLEDLTNAVARSIADGGYEVVKAGGMGIRENLEVGRVTPAEIVSFVESHMAGTAADCLFLSCTNWQALAAIEPLRRKLGMLIITSNQATIDTIRKIEQGERGQASILSQLQIEARTWKG
jgi:maleate isomerase